jgi:uncharacterized membrane protein YphA (DoxX/SURF4 family)
MNIALWVAQILLAGLFGMAGVLKTFQVPKVKEQMPWAKNRSDAFVRFVGISELLGGLGMILPLLTGILPWLTPLAAVGLAVIQVLAILTEHLPKKEYTVIPMNVILLALSIFVVAGYWGLFTS